MCGIVAYLGNQQAEPIVIKGLRRLEYRGYDSTGISLFYENQLHTTKTAGKVSDLTAILDKEPKIQLPLVWVILVGQPMVFLMIKTHTHKHQILEI
jgi:glucosamine 6-phosphate synthetase-like amidotransferase/phosphosugar isomerase protein